MNCPKCGKEISEGAVFCRNCGASIANDSRVVSDKTSQGKACPHCGKIINENATFCRYCGKNITDAVSETSNDAKPENIGNRKKKQRIAIIAAICVSAIAVIVGIIMSKSNSSGPAPQTATINDTANETGNVSDVTEPNDGGSSDTAYADIGSDENTDNFTIMVYMIGSDLETDSGAATRDLYEMSYASWGDDVNLLIETGGAREWKNDVVTADSIQRYELRNAEFTECQSIPLEQMSTSSALSDFISWGASNYPAQRYGLVLWNHGGGLLGGYGCDELYDYKSMYIQDVASAIKNSGVRFEFVGYDACLMSCFESAYALKDSANYLIASEESESNIGWYYTDWLNSLGTNPNISMEDLGRIIVDTMVNDNQSFLAEGEAQGYNTRRTSTLALIDLSKMDEVYDAWLSYLNQLNSNLNEKTFAEQSAARSESRTYGDSKRIDPETLEIIGESHTDMLDMLDFIDQTALPGSFDIKKTIQDCVVYSNSDISGSNGLSVYMPYYMPEYYNKLAVPQLKSIGFSDDYFAYFDKFGSYIASGNSDTEFVPTSPTEETDAIDVSIPYYLEFEQVGEQTGIPLSWDQWGMTTSMKVEIGLVFSNTNSSDGEAETVIHSCGESIDNPEILPDGTLIAGSGKNISQYFFSPDSGDMLTTAYSFVVDSYYDDKIMHQMKYTPAVLNNSKNIFIVTDAEFRNADDYNIDILGYIINNGSNTDLRGMLQFAEGDVITHYDRYYVLSESPEALYENKKISFSITVGPHGLEAHLQDMSKDFKDKKEACYRYVITDIYNKAHYTEWLYF